MYFHIGLSKRLWKISIFPIRLWLFSFQQAYKIRMGNGFTKMALDNLGKLKFDSKWYTYQFVKQKQRISLREAWGEFPFSTSTTWSSLIAYIKIHSEEAINKIIRE